MERIKFLLLFSVFVFQLLFFAVSANTVSPVTPQPVSFEQCTKIFDVSKEKLFYLSLASVSANKFTINEIQSTSGYIVFTAGGKHYLASVFDIDAKHSMLKITPVNNDYFFPVGVVTNFFKYIELNESATVLQLNK